ncbi:hypothetical protein QN277_023943 [Acacia crassicarpa]|uniref:Vacuolar protein sorting-associated protein 13A n=1 Tax=Acacia crassicarpa TaxID=499986 RepID=A0AAE1MJL1_9FABA|nr:hypothetical protein QN277_023943 [Acacia crassicarpa]
MFEGLVRQVLLGYLGRYVKDIQKEQLKITLWNEEVLLENVELILEAFDYLQLPFALKQGRVGRLSIKIPWKKLGWDPIIIVLEDVFISASQRGDQEWSEHAVEKREFAAKKAKLAAAELGKLSRRVCGSHAGQSFTSYITAKILDSIQVAIRNFHVLYSDMQNDQGNILIGLKFSSLTITKQHLLTGLSSGRGRIGQVNKTIEIRGLEFYSSIFHETEDLVALGNVRNSTSQSNIRSEGQSYKSILAPCDVTFMFLANRSEKLDESAPQYSVTADLTGLAVSLDEAQLQQMFLVWDYVCTCRLRERYGRYRPWHSPLSRKLQGWPLLWWRYAQESVLSDVRKKLKKTSWRYFGERLNYRRRYIDLYKTKLDFLRQEQPVDDEVLRELEQMEKESDVDDILNYRAGAEYEMQEFFSRCCKPDIGMSGIGIPAEKSSNDERNLGKSQGWLNWLSRGMLGAGGTDDSSQFSGIVSDDVIKDIYEATEFHPLVSSNGDVNAKNESCLCEMKFVIHQFSVTLCSKYDEGTTRIILEGGIIESKLHKEHATIIFKLKSAEMVLLHEKKVILRTRQPISENSKLDIVDHSCIIQVNFTSNHEVALSVKGKLQQLEVTFDAQILSTLMEFYNVCTTFKFQNERVLLSLNGIEDQNTRLFLKAKSILASHKKVVWDISVLNVLINFPWRNSVSDYCNLAMESKSICFMSKNNLASFSSNVGGDNCSLKCLLNSASASSKCLGIQVEDLYEYFEVKLNDLEVTMMNSDQSQKVSMFEQYDTSVFLLSCVIPDESILKQLEVFINIELLKAHFSPSIYGAVRELVNHLGSLRSKNECEILEASYLPNIVSGAPSILGVSVNSNLRSVILRVNLENDGDNSSALMLSLEEMKIWYASMELEEFFVRMQSLRICTFKLQDEKNSCVLLSTGKCSSPRPVIEVSDSETCNEPDHCSGVPTLANACLAINYEAPRTNIAGQKCTMYVNNASIHCYPHVVGLLVRFFDRLTACGTTSENLSAGNDTDVSKAIASVGLQKFGFSNYIEPGSSESACIPVDHFPFVTICNSGSLGNLENVLLYSIPDWRKYFILRDQETKSPRINMRRSKFCHMTFSLELNLCGLTTDFHDSSCIVGTIMLPTCKSSLFFCGDSMDILCSSEGLVLTSPWWTKNFHDYLWGPSSANLSPILNVRVRNGQNIPSTTKLEVSVSIQHVSCMLPAEYLSLIIGYFSLSDWAGHSTDELLNKEQSYIDVENDKSITFKFEILDSILILPVENKEHQFLKIELPQLYCSFIENSCSDDEIKDIPLDHVVPIDKLAQKNHCLNMFSRDLFLSFLLFRNDELGSSTKQNTECVNAALIAPVSANVWVRIPIGNESNCQNSYPVTSFMTIISCQIIAEDSYIFEGLAALVDVIDGFSSVGDQSNYFKSDVLQFIHSKRSSKEIRAVSPTASSITYTEMNFCVQSLLINFYHTKEDSVELIFKTDMQFNCSASLMNDALVRLHLGFSSLALHSFQDSQVLAKCTSTRSSMMVLHITFSKPIEGDNELFVCLPSLSIWLHFSEWMEVVNFLNQFCQHFAKTVPLDASLNCFPHNAIAPVKDTAVRDHFGFHHSENTLAHFASEEMKDTGLLALKSDVVGVTFHIPISVTDESSLDLQFCEDLRLTSSSVSFETDEDINLKHLSVSFNLSWFELLVNSTGIQLKSNVDKFSGMIKIAENRRCISWPLFEMVQIYLEAVHHTNQTDTRPLKLEILCDHSNVWLSHPVFYFWGAVKFNIPEEGSSQLPLFDVDFKFQLRKVSLLLTDGRWSCSGPQLDIVVRNILLLVNMTEKDMKCTVTGDFHVNYNNIEKVSWEPFIEPWQFRLSLFRKHEMSVLLNSSVPTDVILESAAELNINISESLIECISRITEMVMDSWHLMGSKDSLESNKMMRIPSAEYVHARKCAAPYVLQNLTSAPLFCHVYSSPVNPDQLDVLDEKNRICVEPGSAIPIYMDENTEQQLARYKPSCSSDSLNEQRSSGFFHHYIMIQLDGTSMPSAPMSMDLVGLTCFEVNFSKVCNENDKDSQTDTASSFVVPVVFDVSVLHYSKLIRIYSTVILSNATSTPLELRFDIPLGLSPKILDPVYPGQQLPLPLHLAEAGSLRWRPVGNSYLWSEAHNLSKLLSLGNKIGNFKSFVCYPTNPSSSAFRCCLSVSNISLMSSGWMKRNVPVDEASNRFVHHIVLNIPLIVSNYIPKDIVLTTDSGGVNHTMEVSEGETTVYHIDPSHDLGLEICIDGFKPSYFKFPRLETFSTTAKFSENKFSLSETLTFESSNLRGPMYVTVERTMDAYSGSREVIISVPFLLYNCTGFPLCITEATSETKEQGTFIPSYYDVGENETLVGNKDGFSLLCSSRNSDADIPPHTRSSLGNCVISIREKVSPLRSFLSNHFFPENCQENAGRKTSINNSKLHSSCLSSSKSGLSSKVQSTSKTLGSGHHVHEKVGPCIYSPNPVSSINNVLVKVSRYWPGYVMENSPYSLWSSPFSLSPPSGSSNVLVPQSSPNSAFILAMTSTSVVESYAGRINAITFQPRYVISNACSKDLRYKQKGTDVIFHLGIGEHAHLHWTETTRDLAVSISYDEPGWQWSGSFLPDHLGDTQLKMRNLVSGTIHMIRVEVQNADISMGDEKIVGSIKGNSGTILILLSNDDTGYMPYRIDNFSKETLRIYQQRCEVFETVVHSYASCLYAWDEPCYSHRLILEVPGERVLGSYALDDVKEYMPVHLPPTSEKPERTFFLSVHAEGATKVLSVLDSNCHVPSNVKKPSLSHSTGKKLCDHNLARPAEYKEKISIVIPHIGISLINSYSQELLFVCMKDLKTYMLQSLDRQSLSFEISFLQVDNQLRSTPYPVMLSFDREYKSYEVDNMKSKDDVARQGEKINQMNSFNSSCDPVFFLAISKWRKKDVSFVSFEYIKLSIADCCLELEQEVILSLFEFFTQASSRLQYLITSSSNRCDVDSVKDSSLSVLRIENLISRDDQYPALITPVCNGGSKRNVSLPYIVPIGAPWQDIYLLSKTQKKIYIEMLELAPIKLTLSFSSAPWMLQNRIVTSRESIIHRGLMALADVEGARIYLKELTIAHHMASLESIQEVLIKHYTWQLLHEIYKVFGSAGVIGNPMGFARSMSLGIRDFLSVPAKSIMKSPVGLITGMAQGTTSLLSNTVYAISDATSQFSKAARKGIVAFTYDDQAVSRMEKHQLNVTSGSKGVINEVLEGLTGLLQSPIQGAERHGLPGVLSGIALGVTGLVAKPAASILEVTGKTALSIRNRSKPNQIRSQRFRVRIPRPLSVELPLRPYSWEEAVGTSVLMDVDDGLKYKDEVLVVCKALKEDGKYAVLTERFILVVFCPNLVKLGKPEFCGIPPNMEWIINSEIGLDSIIHANTSQGVVHIVGSRPDPLLRQHHHSPKKGGGGGRGRAARFNHFSNHLPLSQTNLELASENDAENFLRILLSTIEKGKEKGRGCGHFVHRSNIKKSVSSLCFCEGARKMNST